MRTYLRILGYLSRSEKVYLLLGVLLRSSLAVLDLLGVAIIGVTVSLLSQPQTKLPTAATSILEFSSQLGFQNTYAILAVIGVVLFAGKSVLSLWLTSASNRFASKLEARKAALLFKKVLEGSLEDHDDYSPNRLSFALTRSVSSAFNQSLTALATFIVETSMLLLISCYLFFTSPVGFTAMAMFFGTIGLILFYFMGRSTATMAKNVLDNTILAGEATNEAITSFRQIASSPTISEFIGRFKQARTSAAISYGNLSTLSHVSRHVIEVTMMLGLGLLLLQRSLYGGLELSASTIAVLSVGGFRIMTSMIPLQVVWSTLRQNKVEAALALDICDIYLSGSQEQGDYSPTGNNPVDGHEIVATNLTYKYPRASRQSLNEVNFTISENDYVAIVGTSGSGKSTLADLILGLRSPTAGSLRVGGRDATEIRGLRENIISYVPQQTHLFSGSIWQNVSLSFVGSPETFEKVEEALKRANAWDFVTSLPDGIETTVTPGGQGFSGGQVQRLGLARGLYQNPKILVLDEATSALDGVTERAIASTLRNLSGKITLIVIAHRFETVKAANLILQLSGGTLKASRDWKKIDVASMHFH